MKLKIYNAKQAQKNPKATLQSTGRLGFSEKANEVLKLEAGKYLVMATNDEDDTDTSLYAWLEDDDNGGGFRINKAGEYYNVNTKPLFDELNINYQDKINLIIYDIKEIEIDSKKIYKFVKRIQKRATKAKKTDDTDNQASV